MATSAKRLLASISVLLLCLVASAQEYRVAIDARGKEITGICAISQQEDGSIVGTIVNEFGVKAFDFSYDGKKAKLENVFPPINKWYIKKVLRKDIAFIIANINGGKDSQEGKRTVSFNGNGEIVMTNNKYHITYTFNKIDEQPR